MYIFTRAEGMRHASRERKGKLAFVPTMGALHHGHLALIDQANELADRSVCSIFVNPTQFDQKEDLQKYPRDEAADIQLLIQNKCDYLFLPGPEEVYPPGLVTGVDIDLKGTDKRMEGKFRPGHFRGVLQVVKRLLEIVSPDYLVMGQKDFQQASIVGYMIRELGLPVEMVVGETVREEGGLAMSSRNRRLSAEQLEQSTVIYRALSFIREQYGSKAPAELASDAFQMIENAGLEAEYVELVDGNTLLPVSESPEEGPVVACAAARAGEVRLIDNLTVKGKM